MTSNGCRYCNAQVPVSAVALEGGREEAGLCILHDPDEHKDIALFNALVRVKLDEGDYNFSGFVFPPGTSDLSDWRFENGVDFSSAIFLGETSFRQAQFGGASADFTGAEFHRGADFSQAAFGSNTVFFSNSSFSGAPANFHSARFLGETINFTDARFDAAADFGSAFFHGLGVYFTECIFAQDRADFSNTIFCAKKTVFKWGRFRCETDFSNAQFTGSLIHFQQTVFSGAMAKFDSAKFKSRTLSFSNSRFSGGGCSFAGAQFAGDEADFSGVRFSGISAGFAGATFSCRRTTFNSATFSAEHTDFSSAELSGAVKEFQKSVFSGRSATFAGARFLKGKTEFSSADFSGEQAPTFSEAIFSDPISFHNARFCRGARFDSVRFLDEADFSKANFSTIPGAYVDFRYAHFAGPFVSFESVDLRDTLFAGCHPNTPMYANKARWPCGRYFMHLRKRSTCADERLAREPADHFRTAETLKKLEQAVRKSGASRLPGDFAFSAFECNRKARAVYSPLRYAELLLGAWASGYGQKMWNIVLCSLMVILGFAVILTATGEGLSAPANIGGVMADEATVFHQFGLCLQRSVAAFFSAGLIKLQSTTLHANVLLKIESFFGVLLILAFFVILMRRALLFPKMRR